MGDYNINILNYSSDNETPGFIDTVYASSFFLAINTPTQITATWKTTDSIVYNKFTKNILKGNIATSKSDHFTQFLIITNKNKSLPEKEQINISAYRNYTKDKFNWNDYLKSKWSAPVLWTIFPKIYQFFDKHCPKKKITKKQQKSLPKLWLTKGILKSIKVKNKIYKQFCKYIDPLKKNEFHIKFKTYRNSILKLTHQIDKEDYFKSYFENNKQNSKETWNRIRNLINIKIFEKSQQITFNINNQMT